MYFSSEGNNGALASVSHHMNILPPNASRRIDRNGGMWILILVTLECVLRTVILAYPISWNNLCPQLAPIVLLSHGVFLSIFCRVFLLGSSSYPKFRGRCNTSSGGRKGRYWKGIRGSTCLGNGHCFVFLLSLAPGVQLQTEMQLCGWKLTNSTRLSLIHPQLRINIISNELSLYTACLCSACGVDRCSMPHAPRVNVCCQHATTGSRPSAVTPRRLRQERRSSLKWPGRQQPVRGRSWRLGPATSRVDSEWCFVYLSVYEIFQEEIAERTNISGIIDEMKQRIWRWFGHVLRIYRNSLHLRPRKQTTPLIPLLTFLRYTFSKASHHPCA